MWRTATACVALAVAAALPSSAGAVISSLAIQPNARSAGLADCTMAVLEDATAASWNPGGLAFVPDRLGLSAVYTQLLPDTDEDIYLVHAAGALRVTPEVAVGGTVHYLSYGEFTVVDQHGTESVDAYEFAPSLACAVAVGNIVGVGLNVKHLHIEWPCFGYAADDGTDCDGSAFGVDAGAEARLLFGAREFDTLVRLAGAVRNLGPDVEFGDADMNSPLPRTASIGGSGRVSYRDAGHVLVCAQYDRKLVDDWAPNDRGRLAVGFELGASVVGVLGLAGSSGPEGVRDHVALRLGYENDMDYEEDGISFGLGGGVEWDERFQVRLDLANVPMPNDFTRPWRIQGSLSAQF
ncbi:MAG: PorV/PorQ family protein [Candidatus Eisenbacteria bacterium]|nr:PorV/PorQ family protein [Candidatus Eisenbacteria bacterium]